MLTNKNSNIESNDNGICNENKNTSTLAKRNIKKNEYAVTTAFAMITAAKTHWKEETFKKISS